MPAGIVGAYWETNPHSMLRPPVTDVPVARGAPFPKCDDAPAVKRSVAFPYVRGDVSKIVGRIGPTALAKFVVRPEIPEQFKARWGVGDVRLLMGDYNADHIITI